MKFRELLVLLVIGVASTGCMGGSVAGSDASNQDSISDANYGAVSILSSAYAPPADVTGFLPNPVGGAGSASGYEPLPSESTHTMDSFRELVFCATRVDFVQANPYRFESLEVPPMQFEFNRSENFFDSIDLSPGFYQKIRLHFEARCGAAEWSAQLIRRSLETSDHTETIITRTREELYLEFSGELQVGQHSSVRLRADKLIRSLIAFEWYGETSFDDEVDSVGPLLFSAH